jgi:hypothetical protein
MRMSLHTSVKLKNCDGGERREGGVRVWVGLVVGWDGM